MNWKNKFDAWSESMSSLQKFVGAFILVAALLGTAIFSGIKYTLQEYRYIQKEISNAEINTIRQALDSLDVVTYSDLAPALDSIHRGLILNYIMDTTMHKLSLDGQNNLILSVDELKSQNKQVVVRLDKIQKFVKTIDGTTSLSLKEQRLLAWEDSLRTVNILSRQKEESLARRRQLDMMSTEQLREIQRTLEKNQDLLKKNGKTKIINVKPKKASKRKSFKERILIPL